MAKHPVCFWEINAEDAETLANFYKHALEWEIEHNTSSGFYSVNSGDGRNGGIPGGMFTGQGKLPTHRALYVEVEAIDEIMARVPLHGGKVAQEPFDFEGVGRLAFFRDPEGHMVGLIQRQPKTQEPEAPTADEPKAEEQPAETAVEVKPDEQEPQPAPAEPAKPDTE